MDGLSTEILVNIFSYLSLKDLANLRLTCSRFNEIIIAWDFIKADGTFVTNQKNEKFLSRCPTALCNWDKHRVSHNWTKGMYTLSNLLRSREKFIPWLHLDKESVWISRENKITKYKREGSFVHVSKPCLSIGSRRSNADIVKFVLKNDRIVCGLRDGGIWVYSLAEGALIRDRLNCHKADVNFVDISDSGDLICSGGRDNYFKLWQGALDDSPIYKRDFEDRVWCVRFDPLNTHVALGLAGKRYANTLNVIDLNTLTCLTDTWSVRCRAGISDILWSSPHTLYTVGYDARLRQIDLRGTIKFTKQSDPFDNPSYCLDYDGYNSLMTGHQLHGSVTLWDVRMDKTPVQVYFLRKKSPVYSMAFDATSLFAATDRHLNVLDFSALNPTCLNDYSLCLSNNVR